MQILDNGKDKVGTLCSSVLAKGCNGNQEIYMGGWHIIDNQRLTVRRITCIECERLMNLPDNYTLIDHKSCSKSARFKALGNGMAQNVANWIIKRIVEETECD